jgi:hypothetical protein
LKAKNNVAPSFVVGAEQVVRTYGEWPNFHDAEVVALGLNRKGPSAFLEVLFFKTHPDVDVSGHFRRSDFNVIRFECGGLLEVNLADFNQQNVLAALSFSEVAEGIRIELWPSFGLGGHLLCREAAVVRLEPYRLVNSVD